MREGLPGPEPGHAGQRVGVVGRPVHRPRLLLHDPPAATPDSAVKVMVERLEVRVALPQVAPLVVRGRLQPVGQEPQRVGVPGRDVEIGADGEMVERDDPAHVVVGDRCAGMPADDVDLQAVEAHHLIGGKPAEIHGMRRVGLGHRQVRQLNLVEAGIVHRPEDVAPGPIERVRRLVLLRQPVAEGGGRRRRVAERGIVAAVFVVGLPGRDVRVPAVPLGQEAHDPRALVAVAPVAEAVVAARAETPGPAVRVQGQHVGVAGQDPARRGRCRRAEHDPQPGLAQDLDGAVEPIEAEVTGLGLQPAPGELADSHPGQAERRHARGIVRPLLFRPVLGVVADAQRALAVGHAPTCRSGRSRASRAGRSRPRSNDARRFGASTTGPSGLRASVPAANGHFFG